MRTEWTPEQVSAREMDGPERELYKQQTLRHDEEGRPIIDLVTCGTCGRTWNDAAGSSWTPAPSGRCPFEYDHEPEPEPDGFTDWLSRHGPEGTVTHAKERAARLAAVRALDREIAEQQTSDRELERRTR